MPDDIANQINSIKMKWADHTQEYSDEDLYKIQSECEQFAKVCNHVRTLRDPVTRELGRHPVAPYVPVISSDYSPPVTVIAPVSQIEHAPPFYEKVSSASMTIGAWLYYIAFLAVVLIVLLFVALLVIGIVTGILGIPL